MTVLETLHALTHELYKFNDEWPKQNMAFCEDKAEKYLNDVVQLTDRIDEILFLLYLKTKQQRESYVLTLKQEFFINIFCVIKVIETYRLEEEMKLNEKNIMLGYISNPNEQIKRLTFSASLMYRYFLGHQIIDGEKYNPFKSYQLNPHSIEVDLNDFKSLTESYEKMMMDFNFILGHQHIVKEPPHDIKQGVTALQTTMSPQQIEKLKLQVADEIKSIKATEKIVNTLVIILSITIVLVPIAALIGIFYLGSSKNVERIYKLLENKYIYDLELWFYNCDEYLSNKNQISLKEDFEKNLRDHIKTIGINNIQNIMYPVYKESDIDQLLSIEKFKIFIIEKLNLKQDKNEMLNTHNDVHSYHQSTLSTGRHIDAKVKLHHNSVTNNRIYQSIIDSIKHFDTKLREATLDLQNFIILEDDYQKLRVLSDNEELQFNALLSSSVNNQETIVIAIKKVHRTIHVLMNYLANNKIGSDMKNYDYFMQSQITIDYITNMIEFYNVLTGN